MIEERTIADDVLEACGVIVCGDCKLFMHEHEAEYKPVSNGITTRIVPYHRNGCPPKQEVYQPQKNETFGDD